MNSIKTKFLRKINWEEDQDVITTAVQMVLQGEKIPQNLGNQSSFTRSQKIKITKFHAFLVKLLKLRDENMEAVFEGLDENTQQFLPKVIKRLHLKNKVNNYRWVQYPDSLQNFPRPEQQLLQRLPKNRTLFSLSKMDWKIEVVLSSSLLFSVLRPTIMLCFYTKQGTKRTIYMDINQFKDFRKQIALIMREFHVVESTRAGNR